MLPTSINIDPIQIIKFLYYPVIGLLSFFAIFSVYILIKYSKSLVVGFTAGLLFILLFLSVLARTQTLLHSIKFS